MIYFDLTLTHALKIHHRSKYRNTAY